MAQRYGTAEALFASKEHKVRKGAIDGRLLALGMHWQRLGEATLVIAL